MVKVKFSQKYWAKRKRIQRLPKIMIKVADITSKKDAIGLIRTFREGIIKNSFRLKALQPPTVMRKRAKGLPKPKTPLYGFGELKDKSYLNMLRIRRLKKGYRVAPSWAKHHESKLKLRDLFVVHEFGTVIRQERGGKEILIRIPPRPAFFYAFRRHMARRKKADEAKEVGRAITQYVMTGKQNLLNKIQERAEDFNDYDEV